MNHLLSDKINILVDVKYGYKLRRLNINGTSELIGFFKEESDMKQYCIDNKFELGKSIIFYPNTQTFHETYYESTIGVYVPKR